jgi:hypothetical protein
LVFNVPAVSKLLIQNAVEDVLLRAYFEMKIEHGEDLGIDTPAD